MKKEKEQQVGLKLNKPENLKLEDLIKPEFPFYAPVRKDDGSNSHRMTTGKRILKHLPALYFFIHVLLERQHSDIETLRLMYDESYVKMFSRDIEPLKSKNDFRFIWGILRTLKIIEEWNNLEPNMYRKSAVAYYFRLAEPYRSSPVVQHEVMIRKSVNDKLNVKWNIKPLKAIDLTKINNNKALAHQYMALRSIKMDYSAARLYSTELLINGDINVKQYNSNMISISNLENGRIKVSYSDKCHRFYTPVTSMPKLIRPFIRDAEGNSLVELDYGSFNAFAVYKILNAVNPDYETNADKFAFRHELSLYKDILSGGDFYRDFKTVFFPQEDLTRDQVKDIVLKKWFNGKPESRNKHRKHIVKRLPKISEIIDSLKAKQYENFSNIAMRLESELVNDIVYAKFVELYPNAIMYTIFDSFLVESRYASQLYTMMLEEGNHFFDLNCIVNTKSDIA